MKIIRSTEIDQHSAEINAWLATSTLSLSVEPDASPLGVALRNYLALTHLRELVANSATTSEVDLFYSRYFWLLAVSALLQSRAGFDAGMDQQVFQLLEEAPSDVDWAELEAIERDVLARVSASVDDGNSFID